MDGLCYLPIIAIYPSTQTLITTKNPSINAQPLGLYSMWGSLGHNLISEIYVVETICNQVCYFPSMMKETTTNINCNNNLKTTLFSSHQITSLATFP